MVSSIDFIYQSFEDDLSTIKSLHELETLTVKYLGRKGIINNLLLSLKDLDSDNRAYMGKSINDLKRKMSEKIDERKNEVMQSSQSTGFIDTSLPGIVPNIGHLHPTTVTIRSINSFFRYHGFSVYQGPEIETNEFNFEKLNLPLDHPARDLADTLYISEPEWLLRTHTSSVETRAMTTESLPIRIVVPGKVYRNETSNVTNNAMFYQYEGLVVGKSITMANLKATLMEFAKFLYGDSIKTRFRCKYYPQVEPGVGFDIGCTFCGTKGCPVCKYRGFLEVLGAGMVHPNVLLACGIDSSQWSGFAFGMGLDRLVMLTYGISDIRKLYNGELVVV